MACPDDSGISGNRGAPAEEIVVAAIGSDQLRNVQNLEINRGSDTPPPSFVGDGMRVSAETGAPLAIYDTNVVLDEAEPELMARQCA